MKETGSELLFVVHGSDERCDLLFGELAHRGVEEILFFREFGERGRKVGLLQAEESLRPRSVSNPNAPVRRKEMGQTP